MSDLDRVLDERLASFRPAQPPPFGRVLARRDRRRRIGSASAVGLSAVAVAGVALLGPQLVASTRSGDSLADGQGTASEAEVRATLCPFADRPLDTAEQRTAVVQDLNQALQSISTFTPDAQDVFEPAVRMANAGDEGSEGPDVNITAPGAPPSATPGSSRSELSASFAEERRRQLVQAQADLRAACTGSKPNGASDLSPRSPSLPGHGVVGGSINGAPGEGRRAITLRLVGAGGQFDIRGEIGGTFSLEVPAGTYEVTSASGAGVCPDRLTVGEGWQRLDVLTPCNAAGVPLPADPPFAPPPPPE